MATPQGWALRGFMLRTEEAAGDELADFLGEGRLLRGLDRNGGGSTVA